MLPGLHEISMTVK